MKVLYKLLVLSVLSGLYSVPTLANPPTLEDLGWMQGSWSGRVGGTDTNPQFLEETWSTAEAGTMMAMVRMRSAEATIFVELISITQSDGAIYLHIQQFAPDMTPRFAPAQRMKLTNLADYQATFIADTPGGLDTLTYTREGSAFTIDVTLSEGTKFIAPLHAQ